MTVPENPLARWSRLKRETSSGGSTSADQECQEARSTGLATTELDEDLQDLPSIDTITVETDIRAFLRSRVPAELTRAALRRAWTSDPAIRDFIGIAENQWDFNDPTSIPGFGPLQVNDDISELLRRAFGQTAEFAAAVTELPIAVEPAALEIVRPIDAPDQADSPGASHAAAELAKIEPAPEQVSSAPPKRRTHGGALPR